MSGDAYMDQWTTQLLIQVMDCRLFGIKPLPEPIVMYFHQLDLCEKASWTNASKYMGSNYFPIENIPKDFAKGVPVMSGVNLLIREVPDQFRTYIKEVFWNA